MHTDEGAFSAHDVINLFKGRIVKGKSNASNAIALIKRF